MALYSGQGKVFIAPRLSNGNAGIFRYLGKTDDGLKMSLDVSYLESTESESGQRLKDLRIPKEKNATFDVGLKDFTKENIALALWGAAATISAGTVTAEALPTGIAVGDFATLAKQNVSSVVVKDSAGTPATLTANTNYRVSNASLGTVEFLDITTGRPFTQPFKADYSNGIVYNVPMFGVVPGEWYLRFEGLNTANSGAPVLVEFYRVSLAPLKEFALKSGDLTVMNLSGAALYDETKTSDPVHGVFGRVVTLS